MGAQIILGTPLFSADVFQWAGFCNGTNFYKLYTLFTVQLLFTILDSS